MRDFCLVLIMVGVVYLFPGCNSSPEAIPANPVAEAFHKEEVSVSDNFSEINILDYPDWVLTPPREEGYYFGVGGGDNLAEAKQKALVNTGQQFCVTVKSALFEQDSIQGERMEQVFTSVDEQLTYHLLRGVKFCDEYEDDEGGCWVLARAPLECSLDVAEGFLLSYFLEIKQESQTVVSIIEAANDIYSKQMTGDHSFYSSEMILVRGESFFMGNDEGSENESPRHNVTVDDFFIGRYETNQGEWLRVMGELPGNLNKGSGFNYPVYNVSWEEVIEYCNRKSVLEGFNPCYENIDGEYICLFSADGYRLPTEAEWEFAAIGGKESSPSQITRTGWFMENSENSIHEAGSMGKNPLGLYDITGNVWEWCWDWYGDYSRESETNPAGPDQGERKVIRGGAWTAALYGNNYLTYRNYSHPGKGYSNLGFRVVRRSL